MILYRTKLFGFYDEAGKLKEQYIKSAIAKKRFEKWKENMKNAYNQLRKNNGLEGIETDFEEFLRNQSAARDRLADTRRWNRKYLTIDPNPSSLGTFQSSGNARKGWYIDEFRGRQPNFRYNTTDYYDKDVNKQFVTNAINKKNEIAMTSGAYQDLLEQKILNERKNKELIKDYKEIEENNQNTINKLTSENSTLANKARHYEGQYNQANKTIEDLNNTINNNNARIEEMGKINDLNNKTIEDLRDKDTRNRREIMELDNSRGNWMLGTGIASALGVTGTGAGIVYGSKKSKKNKK